MTDPVIRTFESSDGYCHHFRCWSAESVTGQPPRGLIVAVHGIQSHSGWYLHSSAALAAAGYSVYFADRRGSGMNTTSRGHSDHGLRLINDVRQLIQLARDEYADSQIPVTLMGISWGGKIAAATAAVSPKDVDRLVLLYPGLVPRLKPSLFQRIRLRLARHFDVRHRPVTVPLKDPGQFTDSRQWKQFIRQDRLALHEVTTGLLNSGVDLDQIIAHQAKLIVQPTLLMLAGHDAIIDNELTRQQVATFGSQSLTIRTWPDACHTLEFEENRDVINADIVDWLNRSLAK